MPAELTDDGLNIQTLDEIRTELHTSLRDPVVGFGPDFILDEHEPIPMLVGIFAEREARIQALALAVLHARVPGSARGVHADDIAAITGTERRPATYSSVAGVLHGTALANIPIARIVRHNPTETLWETTTAVVLDPAGNGDVVLRAQSTGPIEIVATTDWSIITGDAALTSVESTADSTPGSLVESDEVLEERRIDELATLGKASADAIRANLQQDVTGLRVAAVFVNTSHVADADGLAAQSIEILIDDGGLIDDEVIARAIWSNISAGTRTQGNVEVTFVDDNLQSRTLYFSRATQVTAWVRVTVSTTGAEVAIADPSATEDAIEVAVAALGDTLAIGRDVLPVAFIGTVLAQAPANSITAVTIEISDDGATWQSTPFTIDPRERAVFDTSRVVVVGL